MDDIEIMIREVAGKESSVLCREVTSIGDAMDVIRSKWVPEILTAVICGETRFKDIQAAVHGISDKVLTERLRQMVDDRLLEKTECYGYPPRVEYRLTEHGKRLYAIIYRMTEWGQEHRSIMIKWDIGLNEISLGVESGDDWILKRIDKGYTSADILEQCHKLEEAGIAYWVTFLNGVAGREHSRDHAINSAKIFNQLKPMLVGTGGLTLFAGTPLLEEAQRGEFTPLTEKELMEELKLFVENLTCDCEFNTHHTSSMNLSGPFLPRKQQIIAALQYGIDHYDLDRLTAIRQNKRTL